MATKKEKWSEFIEEIDKSERFLKVQLTPPEHGGNIATISGEVDSSSEHDEIAEMAKQKGFLLFTQNLLVPCNQK